MLYPVVPRSRATQRRSTLCDSRTSQGGHTLSCPFDRATSWDCGEHRPRCHRSPCRDYPATRQLTVSRRSCWPHHHAEVSPGDHMFPAPPDVMKTVDRHLNCQLSPSWLDMGAFSFSCSDSSRAKEQDCLVPLSDKASNILMAGFLSAHADS